MTYIVAKMTYDHWGNIRLDERSTEAIPIEWIRDYIMTTYCTEYDNPQLKGIERLLEGWEKENER